MKNLKAIAKYPLGRRWIKPGDTFSLEDKLADLMVKAKKAVYHTTDMKAETNKISPVTGKPKRKYQRRDMKADDE